MPKKLQLHIPEPCHEDWDRMTPSEKGRFCASCRKQVIDFTGMSDQQLVQFFKKPSTGSVCGRFMQDQLERDMMIPRKRIPWLKYFFQFAIPAFLVSMKATAQGGVLVKEKEISRTKISTNEILASCTDTKDEQSVVKKADNLFGRVVDPEGKGIPYASILFKDTFIGAACDSAGKFILKFSMEGQEQLTLQCSATGYISKEILLERALYNSNDFKVVLYPSPALEEVVVISSVYVKGRLSGKVGGVRVCYFGIKDSAFTNVRTAENQQLKIYPNPAQRSQPIKIQFTADKEEALSARLISIDGKIMMEKKITSIKGANLIEIPTDSKWSAGVYLVTISDAAGKFISQQKILLN